MADLVGTQIVVFLRTGSFKSLIHKTFYFINNLKMMYNIPQAMFSIRSLELHGVLV